MHVFTSSFTPPFYPNTVVNLQVEVSSLSAILHVENSSQSEVIARATRHLRFRGCRDVKNLKSHPQWNWQSTGCNAVKYFC